mmetsp:Transcript_425/g.1662  ORF Transcript_425/g.1662 Transcript_425/m.1662 type:complete len:230 (+) Transcript_425:942-1631(+)
MFATSQLTQSCTSPPVASTASFAFFTSKPICTRFFTAPSAFGTAFSPEVLFFFVAVFFSGCAVVSLSTFFASGDGFVENSVSTTNRRRSAVSNATFEAFDGSASSSTVMMSSTRIRFILFLPAIPPLLWFLPMYASAPRVLVEGGSGRVISSTCASVNPYFSRFSARRVFSASGFSFPPWFVMRPLLRYTSVPVFARFAARIASTSTFMFVNSARLCWPSKRWVWPFSC